MEKHAANCPSAVLALEKASGRDISKRGILLKE